jgi:hypothetical protein
MNIVREDSCIAGSERPGPTHKRREHISQDMFCKTCPGLHAWLRENSERTFHGTATDDAPEVASQAAGYERGAAATHAHAQAGTGSLLARGPLAKSRRTTDRSCPLLFPAVAAQNASAQIDNEIRIGRTAVNQCRQASDSITFFSFSRSAYVFTADVRSKNSDVRRTAYNAAVRCWESPVS